MKAIYTGLALAALAMSATQADAKREPKKAKEEAAAVAMIDIAPPPPGKGQIVFFRRSAMGFAVGCQVNENGQRVSGLGAGRYFSTIVDPGPKTYMVSSEAKDVLNLEIEPDETQYVNCKIKMGIMMGRPNLAPSTKAEFDEASKSLKMVDADDMGPKKK
jgi:hypothetical protein